jgi:DNA-binding transcriptional MerR regulator
MKKKTYSIGDASKMSGASQKQIRSWEAKGYIPKAEHSVSGDRSYRRFTLEQVDTISRIVNLLEEGYTLSAAAGKARNIKPGHAAYPTSGDFIS